MSDQFDRLEKLDKSLDDWHIVQRHEEESGDDDGLTSNEIYYEVINYYRDIQLYVHGPNAKREAERLCKQCNAANKDQP